MVVFGLGRRLSGFLGFRWALNVSCRRGGRGSMAGFVWVRCEGCG